MHKISSNKVLGYGLIFSSVILFSAMTILVKQLTRSGIPVLEISFFRFFIGTICVLFIGVFTKQKVRPKNVKWLMLRAFGNTFAVILFFIAIDLSGAAKGTVFNLMYPLFVAILSPFFLKERLTVPKMLFVAVGLLGTFVVANISFQKIEFADILGLSAGLTAGFAIVALRKVRLTDEPFTILVFLMVFGFIVCSIAVFPFFVMPNKEELRLLIISGLISFGGQFTITAGFRYVSAVEGAVLSSSRIFVAAIAASFLLSELITMRTILGGILLFAAITALSYIESKEKTKKFIRKES